MVEPKISTKKKLYSSAGLVLADDHKLLLSGLGSTLASAGFSIVGLTLDANEIEPLVIKHDADVLICDIRFSDNGKASGLDVVKSLLQKRKGLKVIFFSQFDQFTLVERAYKIGAKAFINKECEEEKIVDVVKRVIDGEIFIDAKYSNELALRHLGIRQSEDRKSHSLYDLQEMFNSRELFVMTEIAKGKSLSQIARLTANHDDPRIRASERTIQTVSSKIRSMLDVSSPQEIAIIAYKAGLIG